MATLAKLQEAKRKHDEAKRKHDEDVRIAEEAIPACHFTDKDVAEFFGSIDKLLLKKSRNGHSRTSIVFEITFDNIGTNVDFFYVTFPNLVSWWKGAMGKASSSESRNKIRRADAAVSLLNLLADRWRAHSDVPLGVDSRKYDVHLDGYSTKVTWSFDWTEPTEAPAKKHRAEKPKKG